MFLKSQKVRQVVGRKCVSPSILRSGKHHLPQWFSYVWRTFLRLFQWNRSIGCASVTKNVKKRAKNHLFIVTRGLFWGSRRLKIAITSWPLGQSPHFMAWNASTGVEKYEKSIDCGVRSRSNEKIRLKGLDKLLKMDKNCTSWYPKNCLK